MSSLTNCNTTEQNTDKEPVTSLEEAVDNTSVQVPLSNKDEQQQQQQQQPDDDEESRKESDNNDKTPANNNKEESDDDDALLDGLEDDALFSGYRENRMEELRRQMEEMRTMKENDHGTYKDLESDKHVLSVTTSTKHCIIHFYHADFRRCQIMDKHLEKLATKYFQTRFARMDVEKVPFLVERLKVQMLPCIIMFTDGVTTDRLVGFEELGNTDQFTIRTLEKRLARSGVIKLIEEEGNSNTKSVRKTIYGGAEKDVEDDESDWDLDD